ncbi:MAG: glycerol-3-phosphate 1-O-acyltransferase PlsY [Coriobacteriia bacterium]|nr:glycerol-3-phosphate 1-O-acyltransferase PlsY [Coriobacteriia bacterium]
MDFIVESLVSLPLWATFACVSLFAYLFGAIPFSLMIGKALFGVNLRTEGSGNLGATNTFRVLGAKAGIGILLLDMAKGALPVLVARSIAATVNLSPDATAWLLIASALAAVIGHTASPYIGFRGGKGAATSAGVMLALLPWVFLASAVVFFAVLAATRYVSVATIVTALAFPISTALIYQSLPFTLFALVIGIIVPVLHHANIKRLREGTEPRFSWSDRGKRSTKRTPEGE